MMTGVPSGSAPTATACPGFGHAASQLPISKLT